jgi:hypothetical protein
MYNKAAPASQENCKAGAAFFCYATHFLKINWQDAKYVREIHSPAIECLG